MKIGGIQKLSLIDYPGKTCATIFTQGCNFRCGYCHNPELVDASLYRTPLPEDEIFEFLDRRRGKLDAVTVTGGEPTIQPGLDGFLTRIKQAGFLVKLDTNGSQPHVVADLIRRRLVDYVAMDVKGPLSKYRQIACVKMDMFKITQSIKAIADSGIDHEFRTTVVWSQLGVRDLIAVARLIRNAPLYALQAFVPANTLDGSFCEERPYSSFEMDAIRHRLEEELPNVVIR